VQLSGPVQTCTVVEKLTAYKTVQTSNTDEDLYNVAPLGLNPVFLGGKPLNNRPSSGLGQ
jgi:hypothetical protein